MISLKRGCRRVPESQWRVGSCRNRNGTSKQLPSLMRRTSFQGNFLPSLQSSDLVCLLEVHVGLFKYKFLLPINDPLHSLPSTRRNAFLSNLSSFLPTHTLFPGTAQPSDMFRSRTNPPLSPFLPECIKNAAVQPKSHQIHQ